MNETEQSRISNIRAANKCHNSFLVASLGKYKLNEKGRLDLRKRKGKPDEGQV